MTHTLLHLHLQPTLTLVGALLACLLSKIRHPNLPSRLQQSRHSNLFLDDFVRICVSHMASMAAMLSPRFLLPYGNI